VTIYYYDGGGDDDDDDEILIYCVISPMGARRILSRGIQGCTFS